MAAASALPSRSRDGSPILVFDTPSTTDLQDLGGFKEWPLLEDLELVDRLRKIAPPAIADAPVVTSGR